LPPHLERAFETKTIAARDLAARWKSVAAAQDATRTSLKTCASPRDLMEKLAEVRGQNWREKKAQYDQSSAFLASQREQSRSIEAQIEALRTESREATARALDLETEKGAHFRAEVAPLRNRLFEIKENAAQRLNPVDEAGKPRRLSKSERAELAALEARESEEIAVLRAQIEEKVAARAHFDVEIAAQRQQARTLKTRARELVAARLEIEKSAAALQARARREQLENEAELERLLLVRDAIWVSDGLRYTDARPTAWWLPLVSPDGSWFRALAQGAQARIEEL
jgi:hypothetical protein